MLWDRSCVILGNFIVFFSAQLFLLKHDSWICCNYLNYFHMFLNIIFMLIKTVTVAQMCSVKMVIRQALTLMSSCEFYDVFKNTYFIEHLWTTASVNNMHWTYVFCLHWNRKTWEFRPKIEFLFLNFKTNHLITR